MRKDVEGPLTFTLMREEINVKSVRAKMLEPGYGYLRVRQFQERTGEDLAKALTDLYKQGELKGLVLDLRSDPGGLLNQAVAVSAAFLPKDALVVYTDGRTPDARMRLSATQGATTRAAARTTSRTSRPASRRCRWSCWSTAARRRRRRSSPARCRITSARSCMGAQTFGKGSVQTILPLGNNAGLKLTTARYYTPSGRSIQAKGIEPDIVVDDGRDSPNRIARGQSRASPRTAPPPTSPRRGPLEAAKSLPTRACRRSRSSNLRQRRRRASSSARPTTSSSRRR